jgi:serine protease Do
MIGVIVLGATLALSSGHSPVPADDDVKVIKKIVHSDSKAWLGVAVEDVSADRSKELGMKKTEGAYVKEVIKKSPADSAGIREGDVIVEFAGRTIYDADGLVSAVRKTEVGTKAKITVLRKGVRKEMAATIQKPPKRKKSMALVPPGISKSIHVFRGLAPIGLTLRPLNEQLGKYFDVPEGKGLLVERVEEGSGAEKAGFMAGDVILRVGETSVSKVHEFRTELAKKEDGEKVSVEVLRKGSKRTLTVEVEKSDNMEGYEFHMGDSPMPERFDINIDMPEWEEFNFDEIRPELDRLRREIDRLKIKIEEKTIQRIMRNRKIDPSTSET